GAAFVSCDPAGASYSGLSDANHIFAVRAVDVGGNLDGAPPSRTWTVDTAPPLTTILTGPPVLVSSTGADFTYSASETSTFECSLDGLGFTACPSTGTSYTGLAHGP